MNTDKVSKGLGLFSLVLGAAQLFAGRRLGRTIGVGGNHPKLMGGLGLREIVSGIGILTGRRRSHSSWLWGRVGGDVMDLALLGSAVFGSKTKKGRVGAAIASVAAVTLLDYLAARQQSKRNK